MEKVTKMSEGITVDTSSCTVNKPLVTNFHPESEPPNGTKRTSEKCDQLERICKNKKTKKQNNNLATSKQNPNTISGLLSPRDDGASSFVSTTWRPQNDFKIPSTDSRLEEGMVKNFQHLYKLLGQFVIIKHKCASPISVLVDSANLNKMDITFDFDCVSPTDHRCSIFIGNVFVGNGSGSSKKIAKCKAARNVFKMMKDVFPVVLKASHRESIPRTDEIQMSDICEGDLTENMKQENKKRGSNEFKEISESNVGHRLLQKMGWSGGGLGKDGQGRQNPIPVEQRPKRAGLGMDLTQYEDKEGKLLIVKMDRPLIYRLLEEVADGTREHLVFSSSLSKGHRSFIHKASLKYGLRSQSYGRNSDRFLTIRRKMSKTELLQSVQKGSAFLS